MSTRVRAIAHNPNYGVYQAGTAYRIIEQLFADRGPAELNKPPLGWKKWPRWKRCHWIAGQIGWTFKVFRESKRTRAKHSLYWAEFQKLGGHLPEKPRKQVPQVIPQVPKKKVLDQVPGVRQRLRDRLYAEPALVWANPPQPLEPIER